MEQAASGMASTPDSRQHAKLAAGIAAFVASLGVILVAVGLVLWASRGFAPLPVSYGRTLTGVIGLVVAALSYTTVGALLVARITRNPIGWLFLAAGLVVAAMLPINVVVAMAHESLRPPAPGVILVAWLRNTFATPGVVTLLIIATLLFPNGRLLGSRWRGAVVTAIVGGGLLAAGAALNREGMVTYPTIPNPTGAPVGLGALVTGLQLGGIVMVVLAIVLAVTSIAVRYRRSDEVRRAQLRWILLAAAISAVTAVPFLLVRYLVYLVDVGDAAGELAALGVQLGMSTFPLAAAFAISRYRLYDVDLLIGRTLVYVPLMAVLGGLYTASIVLFQRLFVALTGTTSDVALLLTVLVVASAFTPLRKLLEGTLERRFAAVAHDADRPFGGRTGSSGPGKEARPPVVTSEAQPRKARGRIPENLPQVPVAALRAFGPDGRVECPIDGSRADLTRCLACSYFRAITAPPHAGIACVGRPA